MGPIPALPSSGLLPTPIPLHPSAEKAPPSRSGETRPVELPVDQVLAVSDDASAERTRDTPRTPAERVDSDSAEEKEPKAPALPIVDLDRAGIRPRNHVVTYRVHPDLQRSLQGSVIDRDTSEILREVPTEERIHLAKAFREHIGITLDTLA